MDKGLLGQIVALKQKLEKIQRRNSKITRYIKELNELTTLYSGLNIPQEKAMEYEEKIKLGKELNEGDNYRNIKKIDKFIPSCFYLFYDIKDEIKGIVKRMMYAFFITCILFIIVSSQIFPMLVTILFILPMYIGVRGLSRGSARGIMIGMSVVEFSTLTGFGAIMLMILSLSDYNGFQANLIKNYANKGINMTSATLNVLVVIYTMLAAALLAASIYYIIQNYKYKKMFS